MDRVEMVPFSTCWYWTGGTDHAGYGKVRHDKKVQMAHRVSYQMHIGHIPDGLYVCHKCDERSCVNPNHLFLGTPIDNMRDRDAKGRTPAGEACKRTRISDATVREMMYKIESGQRQKDVAAEYGITTSHISKIYSGKLRKTASIF